MSPRQDNFRMNAKTALLAKRITITALAAAIGKSRPATSRAINHNEFPSVRRAIANRLGISL